MPDCVVSRFHTSALCLDTRKTRRTDVEKQKHLDRRGFQCRFESHRRKKVLYQSGVQSVGATSRHYPIEEEVPSAPTKGPVPSDDPNEVRGCEEEEEEAAEEKEEVAQEGDVRERGWGRRRRSRRPPARSRPPRGWPGRSSPPAA